MVDRCICEDMTFVELLELARREGLNFEALAELTGCGQRCGLCEPYLRTVLKTGVTEQSVARTASQ